MGEGGRRAGAGCVQQHLSSTANAHPAGLHSPGVDRYAPSGHGHSALSSCGAGHGRLPGAGPGWHVGVAHKYSLPAWPGSSMVRRHWVLTRAAIFGKLLMPDGSACGTPRRWQWDGTHDFPDYANLDSPSGSATTGVATCTPRLACTRHDAQPRLLCVLTPLPGLPRICRLSRAPAAGCRLCVPVWRLVQLPGLGELLGMRGDWPWCLCAPRCSGS